MNGGEEEESTGLSDPSEDKDDPQVSDLIGGHSEVGFCGAG